MILFRVCGTLCHAVDMHNKSQMLIQDAPDIPRHHIRTTLLTFVTHDAQL
jgi:hypothetical protein